MFPRIVELKNVASQFWPAGDKVHWVNTDNKAMKTAKGNKLIGVATEAVAGGAGELIGRVGLNASC